MTDRKLLLLKTHQYADGLTDAELAEVASHAEIVQYAAGETAQQTDELITQVSLVVQGRFTTVALDQHGNPFLELFLNRGDQFGVVSAAYGKAVPGMVVASEPSTVLQFDYKVLLELTKNIEVLRENFSRAIAGGVHSLIYKKKPAVRSTIVAVFHESEATRPLTLRIVRRLMELGETPCVLSDAPGWELIEGVKYRSALSGGDYLSNDEVRRQVNQWSDAKRVFMDIGPTRGEEEAARVFRLSGEVLWCVTPDNWQAAAERLKAIETRAPDWRDKIHIVWLLSADQSCAPPAPELLTFAKKRFQLSFDQPKSRQGRLLANGLERLIHHLRGLCIGVALGGGAARGMAHLGVLKALENNGIVIDMMAGTSAGAMTGVFYAANQNVDDSVQNFVTDLTPPWFFRQLPAGNYWHLVYKYRRGHFDRMLRKYLADNRLEQIPVPMHTVTVDLVCGEAVIREDGDAVHAILESINLPVLASPICREGRTLVDGGLINNIPADVLVSKGCNFVIAVSVTAKMEHEFAKNRPETPTGSMKSPWAIQTLLRGYVVQSANMHSMGIRPADAVIAPDVTQFDLAEFMRTDELSAVGEQTAIDAIPHIKELLSQMDDKLYPDVPEAGP
jgi:NTE family protein